METQRLETISQPHAPALRRRLTSGFLPSCVFLPSRLLPPPRRPAPLIAAAAASSAAATAAPPFVSSPAAAPRCPRTAPSLPSTGDSGKGAEGRREADTALAARQPRGETRRQRTASPTPFLPSSANLVTPSLQPCQGSGRKKWEIPLPRILRMSEPSMLKIFLY